MNSIWSLMTCACLPDGHDDAAYVILLVLGGLAQRLSQLQLHKVLQLRVYTPPDHHTSSHPHLLLLYHEQSYWSGSGPSISSKSGSKPDPGFWWPKLKNSWDFFSHLFWSKVAIFLKPLKKKFFTCLWVIFALLDPDPDPETPLNPDLIWIRIHNTYPRDTVCTLVCILYPHTGYQRGSGKEGPI